jgi:hypothetical protein
MQVIASKGLGARHWRRPARHVPCTRPGRDDWPKEDAMTGRQAALAVALALTAQVALAQDDRAVPRGGGSSGGSSAGRDHHAGASSSRDGGSSGGSSISGGGGSSRHEPTLAQRRHPRAGTGSGHLRGRGSSYYFGSPYYGSRYYGYGYYGSPYYGGWGLGYYSPYYYSGFYGYSPYYYGSRGYRAGAVRVLVEPNDARVYVDGYYAGVADDFDGIFQRLHLAPGRHDISLRLDGYRTQNFKLYVPYDHTIKIHHRMVAGSPTDVSEEVVGRPEDVADAGRERDDRYADADEFDDRYDDDDLGPGNVRGETGTVRLSVRPTDASIYVDGAFRGTGRIRSLRLPAGRHRIEVVRPGYRTDEREVDVQPGREVEVSFDLDRS